MCTRGPGCASSHTQPMAVDQEHHWACDALGSGACLRCDLGPRGHSLRWVRLPPLLGLSLHMESVAGAGHRAAAGHPACPAHSHVQLPVRALRCGFVWWGRSGSRLGSLRTALLSVHGDRDTWHGVHPLCKHHWPHHPLCGDDDARAVHPPEADCPAGRPAGPLHRTPRPACRPTRPSPPDAPAPLGQFPLWVSALRGDSGQRDEHERDIR